jgi:carboxylesterase
MESQIFTQFNPFRGDEHQPFYWNGGQPAALLVHGFPGTPAEMRPLGTALHEAGWTVYGPLLPGFGPQIETIFERDYTEWIAAVEATLAELQQKHRPVLLVGHSLGNADFSDPEIRRGVFNFMPDIDLDNPAIWQELRDFSIPVRIFEQLVRAGQGAYRLAPQVNVPTLIIQGNQDETVPANRTHRLRRRLPGLVRFEEVNTGHDLIRAEDPGWPEVEQAVLSFARFVKEPFAESIEGGHNADTSVSEKIV